MQACGSRGYFFIPDNLAHNKSPYRIIVTIITVWTFLFNTIGMELAWAANPSRTVLPASGTDSKGGPGHLILPADLGSIVDAHTGENKRHITLIQDAHCNYSCQRSIEGIISHLTANGGVKTALLEGGSGDYDISIFTDIEDKALRGKVADYFVKEGRVNGAELFAINNPDKITLKGLEKASLYKANLKAYRGILPDKDKIDEDLRYLSGSLSALKKRIYTGQLMEFDSKRADHKASRLSLEEYIEYLEKTAEDNVIDTSDYGSLHKVILAGVIEETIDFKAATRQRRAFITRLGKRLSRMEKETLVRNAALFKNEVIPKREFYAYLFKKARTVDIDTVAEYPALSGYAEYIGLFESAGTDSLFSDIKALEKKIADRLFSGEEERRLYELSENLAILKDLFNISLTPEDYRHYNENRHSFEVGKFTDFIKKRSAEYGVTPGPAGEIVLLDNARKKLDRFYRLARKRDNAFIDNIMRHNDNNTVVVTGGFHTERLKTLLKESGYSYTTILPKFEPCDKSPYFRLLAGGLSLVEERLKAKASAIPVPPAFSATAETPITQSAIDEASTLLKDGEKPRTGTADDSQKSKRIRLEDVPHDKQVAMAMIADIIRGIRHGIGIGPNQHEKMAGIFDAAERIYIKDELWEYDSILYCRLLEAATERGIAFRVPYGGSLLRKFRRWKRRGGNEPTDEDVKRVLESAHRFEIKANKLANIRFSYKIFRSLIRTTGSFFAMRAAYPLLCIYVYVKVLPQIIVYLFYSSKGASFIWIGDTPANVLEKVRENTKDLGDKYLRQAYVLLSSEMIYLRLALRWLWSKTLGRPWQSKRQPAIPEDAALVDTTTPEDSSSSRTSTISAKDRSLKIFGEIRSSLMKKGQRVLVKLPEEFEETAYISEGEIIRNWRNWWKLAVRCRHENKDIDGLILPVESIQQFNSALPVKRKKANGEEVYVLFRVFGVGGDPAEYHKDALKNGVRSAGLQTFNGDHESLRSFFEETYGIDITADTIRTLGAVWASGITATIDGTTEVVTPLMPFSADAAWAIEAISDSERSSSVIVEIEVPAEKVLITKTSYECAWNEYKADVESALAESDDYLFVRAYDGHQSEYTSLEPNVPPQYIKRIYTQDNVIEFTPETPPARTSTAEKTEADFETSFVIHGRPALVIRTIAEHLRRNYGINIELHLMSLDSTDKVALKWAVEPRRGRGGGAPLIWKEEYTALFREESSTVFHYDTSDKKIRARLILTGGKTVDRHALTPFLIDVFTNSITDIDGNHIDISWPDRSVAREELEMEAYERIFARLDSAVGQPARTSSTNAAESINHIILDGEEVTPDEFRTRLEELSHESFIFTARIVENTFWFGYNTRLASEHDDIMYPSTAHDFVLRGIVNKASDIYTLADLNWPFSSYTADEIRAYHNIIVNTAQILIHYGIDGSLPLDEEMMDEMGELLLFEENTPSVFSEVASYPLIPLETPDLAEVDIAETVNKIILERERVAPDRLREKLEDLSGESFIFNAKVTHDTFWFSYETNVMKEHKNITCPAVWWENTFRGIVNKTSIYLLSDQDADHPFSKYTYNEIRRYHNMLVSAAKLLTHYGIDGSLPLDEAMVLEMRDRFLFAENTPSTFSKLAEYALIPPPAPDITARTNTTSDAEKLEWLEGFMIRHHLGYLQLENGIEYAPTPFEILPEIFNRIEAECGPLHDKNYLSVGCGPDLKDALYAAYMRGMNATAVEISRSLSELAIGTHEEAVNERFATAENPVLMPHIDVLDIEWNDFDVAYFYYTEPADPKEAKDMYRRLQERVSQMRPGGVLALLIPAPQMVGMEQRFPQLEPIYDAPEWVSTAGGGLFLQLYRYRGWHTTGATSVPARTSTASTTPSRTAMAHSGGVDEIVLNGETTDLDEVRRIMAELAEKWCVFNAQIKGNRLLLSYSSDYGTQHSDLKNPGPTRDTHAGFISDLEGSLYILPQYNEMMGHWDADEKTEEHNLIVMLARALRYCGFPGSLALHIDTKDALKDWMFFGDNPPQTLEELADTEPMTAETEMAQMADADLAAIATEVVKNPFDIDPADEKRLGDERYPKTEVTLTAIENLHARPAMPVSRLANKIESVLGIRIYITNKRNDCTVLASSMLSLINPHFDARKGDTLLLEPIPGDGDQPQRNDTGVMKKVLALLETLLDDYPVLMSMAPIAPYIDEIDRIDNEWVFKDATNSGRTSTAADSGDTGIDIPEDAAETIAAVNRAIEIIRISDVSEEAIHGDCVNKFSIAWKAYTHWKLWKHDPYLLCRLLDAGVKKRITYPLASGFWLLRRYRRGGEITADDIKKFTSKPRYIDMMYGVTKNIKALAPVLYYLLLGIPLQAVSTSLFCIASFAKAAFFFPFTTFYLMLWTLGYKDAELYMSQEGLEAYRGIANLTKSTLRMVRYTVPLCLSTIAIYCYHAVTAFLPREKEYRTSEMDLVVLDPERVRKARLKEGGIFFDFDDTLWTGLPWDLTIYMIAKWLKRGSKPSPKDIAFASDFLERELGNNYEDAFDNLRNMGVVNVPLNVDEFIKRLLRRSEGQVEAENRLTEEFLVPGAKDLLGALHDKSIKLAVVTGGKKEKRKNYAERLGIGQYFSEIHGNGRKPQSIASQMKEWGFRPEQAAMFGDSAKDIEAALANGLLAIGVATSPERRRQLVEAGAHIVINHTYQPCGNLLNALGLTDTMDTDNPTSARARTNTVGMVSPRSGRRQDEHAPLGAALDENTLSTMKKIAASYAFRRFPHVTDAGWYLTDAFFAVADVCAHYPDIQPGSSSFMKLIITAIHRRILSQIKSETHTERKRALPPGDIPVDVASVPARETYITGQEALNRFERFMKEYGSELNERELRVMWMNHFQGYLLKEIAPKLGITEAQTQHAHQRAVKKMREAYEREARLEAMKDEGMQAPPMTDDTGVKRRTSTADDSADDSEEIDLGELTELEKELDLERQADELLADAGAEDLVQEAAEIGSEEEKKVKKTKKPRLRKGETEDRRRGDLETWSAGKHTDLDRLGEAEVELLPEKRASDGLLQNRLDVLGFIERECILRPKRLTSVKEPQPVSAMLFVLTKRLRYEKPFTKEALIQALRDIFGHRYEHIVKNPKAKEPEVLDNPAIVPSDLLLHYLQHRVANAARRQDIYSSVTLDELWEDMNIYYDYNFTYRAFFRLCEAVFTERYFDEQQDLGVEALTARISEVKGVSEFFKDTGDEKREEVKPETAARNSIRYHKKSIIPEKMPEVREILSCMIENRSGRYDTAALRAMETCVKGGARKTSIYAANIVDLLRTDVPVIQDTEIRTFDTRYTSVTESIMTEHGELFVPVSLDEVRLILYDALEGRIPGDIAYHALSLQAKQTDDNIEISEIMDRIRDTQAEWASGTGMPYAYEPETSRTSTVSEAKDSSLLDELLEVYQPIIEGYSEHFSRDGYYPVSNLDHYENAARLALQELLEKYPDADLTEESYERLVRLYIRRRILDQMRKEGPVSQETIDDLKVLNEARDMLFMRDENKNPSTEELAEESGLSRERTLHLLHFDGMLGEALFSQIGDEDDPSMVDRFFADPVQEDKAYYEYICEEAANLLATYGVFLSPREYQLIKMHYIDGMLLQDIAPMLSLSITNTTNVHNDAIAILKEAYERDTGLSLETPGVAAKMSDGRTGTTQAYLESRNNPQEYVDGSKADKILEEYPETVLEFACGNAEIGYELSTRNKDTGFLITNRFDMDEHGVHGNPNTVRFRNGLLAGQKHRTYGKTARPNLLIADAEIDILHALPDSSLDYILFVNPNWGVVPALADLMREHPELKRKLKPKGRVVLKSFFGDDEEADVREKFEGVLQLVPIEETKGTMFMGVDLHKASTEYKTDEGGDHLIVFENTEEDPTATHALARTSTSDKKAHYEPASRTSTTDPTQAQLKAELGKLLSEELVERLVTMIEDDPLLDAERCLVWMKTLSASADDVDGVEINTAKGLIVLNNISIDNLVKFFACEREYYRLIFRLKDVLIAEEPPDIELLNRLAGTLRAYAEDEKSFEARRDIVTSLHDTVSTGEDFPNLRKLEELDPFFSGLFKNLARAYHEVDNAEWAAMPLCDKAQRTANDLKNIRARLHTIATGYEQGPAPQGIPAEITTPLLEAISAVNEITDSPLISKGSQVEPSGAVRKRYIRLLEERRNNLTVLVAKVIADRVADIPPPLEKNIGSPDCLFAEAAGKLNRLIGGLVMPVSTGPAARTNTADTERKIEGLLRALDGGPAKRSIKAALEAAAMGQDAYPAIPSLINCARDTDTRLSSTAEAALEEIYPTTGLIQSALGMKKTLYRVVFEIRDLYAKWAEERKVRVFSRKNDTGYFGLSWSKVIIPLALYLSEPQKGTEQGLPQIRILGGGNAYTAAICSLFSNVRTVEIREDLCAQGEFCLEELGKRRLAKPERIELVNGDLFEEDLSGSKLVYTNWPFRLGDNELPLTKLQELLLDPEKGLDADSTFIFNYSWKYPNDFDLNFFIDPRFEKVKLPAYFPDSVKAYCIKPHSSHKINGAVNTSATGPKARTSTLDAIGGWNEAAMLDSIADMVSTRRFSGSGKTQFLYENHAENELTRKKLTEHLGDAEIVIFEGLFGGMELYNEVSSGSLSVEDGLSGVQAYLGCSQTLDGSAAHDKFYVHMEPIIRRDLELIHGTNKLILQAPQDDLKSEKLITSKDANSILTEGIDVFVASGDPDYLGMAVLMASSIKAGRYIARDSSLQDLIRLIHSLAPRADVLILRGALHTGPYLELKKESKAGGWGGNISRDFVVKPVIFKAPSIQLVRRFIFNKLLMEEKEMRLACYRAGLYYILTQGVPVLEMKGQYIDSIITLLNTLDIEKALPLIVEFMREHHGDDWQAQLIKMLTDTAPKKHEAADKSTGTARTSTLDAPEGWDEETEIDYTPVFTQALENIYDRIQTLYPGALVSVYCSPLSSYIVGLATYDSDIDGLTFIFEAGRVVEADIIKIYDIMHEELKAVHADITLPYIAFTDGLQHIRDNVISIETGDEYRSTTGHDQFDAWLAYCAIVKGALIYGEDLNAKDGRYKLRQNRHMTWHAKSVLEAWKKTTIRGKRETRQLLFQAFYQLSDDNKKHIVKLQHSGTSERELLAEANRLLEAQGSGDNADPAPRTSTVDAEPHEEISVAKSAANTLYGIDPVTGETVIMLEDEITVREQAGIALEREENGTYFPSEFDKKTYIDIFWGLYRKDLISSKAAEKAEKDIEQIVKEEGLGTESHLWAQEKFEYYAAMHMRNNKARGAFKSSLGEYIGRIIENPFWLYLAADEIGRKHNLPDIDIEKIRRYLDHSIRKKIRTRKYLTQEDFMAVYRLWKQIGKEEVIKRYGSRAGVAKLAMDADTDCNLQDLEKLLRREQMDLVRLLGWDKLPNWNNEDFMLKKRSWDPRHASFPRYNFEVMLGMLRDKYEDNPERFFTVYGAPDGDIRIQSDLNEMDIASGTDKIHSITGEGVTLRDIMVYHALREGNTELAGAIGKDERFIENWNPEYFKSSDENEPAAETTATAPRTSTVDAGAVESGLKGQFRILTEDIGCSKAAYTIGIVVEDEKYAQLITQDARQISEKMWLVRGIDGDGRGNVEYIVYVNDGTLSEGNVGRLRAFRGELMRRKEANPEEIIFTFRLSGDETRGLSNLLTRNNLAHVVSLEGEWISGWNQMLLGPLFARYIELKKKEFAQAGSDSESIEATIAAIMNSIKEMDAVVHTDLIEELREAEEAKDLEALFDGLSIILYLPDVAPETPNLDVLRRAEREAGAAL